MAKGVTLKATGLKELQRKFKQLPENVREEVDVLMFKAANDFVNRAVNDAPVDQQIVRQEISSKRLDVMKYDIVSAAAHSAIMEFGSRSKVQVPADLQAYASQFKGMKTTGDAKKAIYAWCKRVGIEEKYWWPVFIKIMTVGVNPHPFFFKQRQPVYDQLQKDLAPAIKKALNK